LPGASLACQVSPLVGKEEMLVQCGEPLSSMQGKSMRGRCMRGKTPAPKTCHKELQ